STSTPARARRAARSRGAGGSKNSSVPSASSSTAGRPDGRPAGPRDAAGRETDHLVSVPMPVAELGTVSDFWEANDQWLTAVASIGVAIATAVVLDRTLFRRGRGLAQTVLRTE